MTNSKYGSGRSRYCYDGTDILINHFDIKDKYKLERLETVLTSKRLSELQTDPIQGRFDFGHLCQIHYHIFQDLYPFAGKIRTENIVKDGFVFAQARHLPEVAKQLFTELMHEQQELPGATRKKVVERLTHYMAEINVLHPFREGNGRSCREFIRCLALANGYELDWAKLPKEEILQATIRSTTDPDNLERVIEASLSKKP